MNEAAHLQAQGRIGDAIALLRRTNRTHRDPSVEAELVRLRFEGAKGYHLSQGRTEPRYVEEAWVDPEWQMPTAQKADLTGDLIRRAIHGRGVLMVPRMLSGAQVETVVGAIDASFRARKERSPESPWYEEIVPIDRRFVGDNAIFTADSPRALFDLLELYAELGIVELVSEFLEERPVLSIDKCTLRKMPPLKFASWHQDGAFLGGADIRTLNVWVALSDCGHTAPGLELVPSRVTRILPTGAFFSWDIKREVIATEIPDVAPIKPDFRAGDVLFFDHLLCHRTGLRPGMTESRYAVESWFYAPSHYPSRGMGLLV